MKEELCFKTIRWYRTQYAGLDYVVRETIDHDFDTTTYKVFFEDSYSREVEKKELAEKVLNEVR